MTVWHFLRLVLSTKESTITPAEQARRVQAWAQALCRVAGIRIELGESGVPKDGALLVANHRSYADIFVLAATRPVLFLAKKEIGGWPLFGTAARRGGTVFVDRKSRQSGAVAIAEMAQRLRAGASLVVFPEGTCQAGPGIGSFRPGSFRMAATDGLPVVPVALEYERLEDAWTDPDDTTFTSHFLQTFSRREVRVRLNFGPPMTGTDPEALRDAAQAWVASHLEAPAAAQAASEPVPA